MSTQKKPIPPPPSPPPLEPVNEWSPPPPYKESSEPVSPEDDSDTMDSKDSIPPPPSLRPAIIVVSDWGGPKPLYDENGEIIDHPANDGSQLAHVVLNPIKSLRRLIKFVSGFLSKLRSK